MNCCDRPTKCKRWQDCPTRVERIRIAKRLLDQDRPRIPLILIGRLALAAAILLAVFVGSMYHNALRSVA